MSRYGFGRPVPRQPAHFHTQAKSGAYLLIWDSSRVPRRRPFICLNRHTRSGQSRVYRVTQLRTDGVHYRESTGTGPVNLKVVPNGCCLGRSPCVFCCVFFPFILDINGRGRVFPAGVRPGSPSRDAANRLPSRFGLSVETRRQYGWLRMVFSDVRPFRAPIWWPSGGWRHARGREHCRGEPGSSLSGGYAPDSAKAEGSSIVDEPG